MEHIKVSDEFSIDVRVSNKKNYDIVAFPYGSSSYDILSGNGKITELKGATKSHSGYAFFKEIESHLDIATLINVWNFKGDESKISIFRNQIIRRLLTKLEQKRVKIVESLSDETKEVTTLHNDGELNIKYKPYYNEFLERIEEVGMTPLMFVSEVTHGLGVGLDIEVVRAWLSYVSTVSGEKGTNVIAIGIQATGKTHCLDSALCMIPSERVIKGIKSEGFFYREYDNMDLTGYIFALGDLGGENDDSKTIVLRDMLKQLTTDGMISRGVVDNDLENESQTVYGFPSITYSTVVESMINGQEASRSTVITPPNPNTHKLMIYKQMRKNQGQYKKVFDRIDRDCLLIQGYVWYIKNSINEYEIFNPYMFCVEEKLKTLDDFNRKIDEFNTLLKLCCIMNKPKKVSVMDDGKLQSVIIASKQDVVNAFRIFDTSGMLATEKILINGIINEYDAFETGGLDAFYEGAVKQELKKEGESWSNYLDCFFTVRTLRNQHNRKYWYKKNREELDLKLEKLYQMGYLINVGKDDRDQVYGIHIDFDDVKEITDTLPKWDNHLIDKAEEIFELCYPSVLSQYQRFIKFDRQKPIKYSDFEKGDKTLYTLAWD